MSLVLPLVKVNGMYQVSDMSTDTTLWMEPVIGILYKDPHWTHYSMIATWLPLANGSGFDPLTGRILLTQATNTHLTLINQVEEYYPKKLWRSVPHNYDPTVSRFLQIMLSMYYEG